MVQTCVQDPPNVLWTACQIGRERAGRKVCPSLLGYSVQPQHRPCPPSPLTSSFPLDSYSTILAQSPPPRLSTHANQTHSSLHSLKSLLRHLRCSALVHYLLTPHRPRRHFRPELCSMRFRFEKISVENGE